MAEHLTRLGHEVMLHAREVGEPVAGWAAARLLPITDQERELPADPDAVIVGLDRGLAVRMAKRYPSAPRLFIVHSEEARYLPPPVAGAVTASVALSDRQAERARASVGAGEVVRLRQPIDLSVFSPRRPISERPRRVVLLGNYHSLPEGRGAALRRAWADGDLEWREVGAGGERTLAVADALSDADIVVGCGRSALEGMACGRAVYIHDHSGTEGWLTSEDYPRLEAGGFAISSARTGRDAAAIRADLDSYTQDLGQVAQDLARAHHDVRTHVAQLVALIERLHPGRPPAAVADPSIARTLINLIEAHLRAEGVAEDHRFALKRARGAWMTENRALEQAWRAEREALEHAWTEERQALERAAIAARRELETIKLTRRYRFTAAVMWPLDRLRRR